MTIYTAFFLILAIISWGTGAFFDKLTLRYINSDSAFFGRTFVMLLTFIPLLLMRFTSTYKELSAANRYSWLYLFLSVSVTMSGVYFYLKAMSASEASRIVPLSSAYPFVTLILAVIFLGESFTLNKFIGTLLITAGICFISR